MRFIGRRILIVFMKSLDSSVAEFIPKNWRALQIDKLMFLEWTQLYQQIAYHLVCERSEQKAFLFYQNVLIIERALMFPEWRNLNWVTGLILGLMPEAGIKNC